MQRLTLGSAKDGDRGAVAILFALTLVVLVGFVGLAVDVGSAYAKAQEVQNAADAGALAIAQECADAKPACVESAQRELAGSLADANIRSGYDSATLPGVVFPQSNRVTVTVTAANQNFFAALFGYETFTIVRAATAQWDAPQSGPAMLPLAVSACSFYDQATGEPEVGVPLTIFVPQGGPPASTCNWHKDYPPGGFGWLVPDASCVAQIVVGKPVEGKDGFSPPGCISSLDIKTNDVVLLPIHDRAWKTKGTQWYEIQRFAALKIEGVFIQQANMRIPNTFAGCGTAPKHHSQTCLKGTFVEWVELDEAYEGGGDETEVSIIRLIDPDYVDS